MKQPPEIPKERLWLIYGSLNDALFLMQQQNQVTVAKGLISWLNLVDIIWEDELGDLKEKDKEYVDSINARLPQKPAG
jgi:hypothetical protein